MTEIVSPTRKQISLALYNTLNTHVAGIAVYGRRVKSWNDVPIKPALLIGDYDEDQVQGARGLPGKLTMNFRVVLYTDVGSSSTVVPADAMNDLLDALDTALKPDIMSGTQTLGGIVSHCWIEGNIFKDPGDLDGQGVAVIPVRVLVP